MARISLIALETPVLSVPFRLAQGPELVEG